MESFKPAQRWISTTEPELGLGLVLQTTPGRVSIRFPASDEVRLYATEAPPLKRVRFTAGDEIIDRDGTRFIITEVAESDGILTYHGEGGIELPEESLSDSISFSKPDERLLAAQVDRKEVYDLRMDALDNHNRLLSSPVRGLLGGRIDLLPHQLYIASEVAGRHAPRVLLADEVGLGKTIEASLILHRLHLGGRAERVMIVVPESLVHQWFVELLRRFNLYFSIYDEDRCRSIEKHNKGTNPFLDVQFVLCSSGFITGDRKRLKQAVQAGWDMLIVDEAHHMEWTPSRVSPEYAAIEKLAAHSEGLMLLTATPEQLGKQGHFARLRLLDPERYPDLGKFLKETDDYRKVARIVDALSEGKPLNQRESKSLKSMCSKEWGEEETKKRLAAIAKNDKRTCQKVIEELLDRHGTGRVMFRNMRSSMEGWPLREASLLPFKKKGARRTARPRKVKATDYAKDPRVPWLADLLRELEDQKVLLICSSVEKVKALREALRKEIRVGNVVFHEGLTLLQRDKNAAWFADDGPKGARILISSEIGSEGRNFQHAHHLVLFDLPADPSLIEQRIGRLDRIGQSETIHVHIPYIEGSEEEIIARWMHEGLNAFNKPLHGGHFYLHKFSRRLQNLIAGKGSLSGLIKDTQDFREEVSRQLEQGRDHLLEMVSFKQPDADELAAQIAENDADPELEGFMLRVFEHFGIKTDRVSDRTYALKPDNLFTDAFPCLKTEGKTVTFDRAKALAREDIDFLTWDHPMVNGAIELLLLSEQGNSSFVTWTASGSQALMLESVYVTECVAPSHLHADRFLSPAPIRVVVDHSLSDLSETCAYPALAEKVTEGREHWLREKSQILQKLAPKLLQKSHKLAKAQLPRLVRKAVRQMEKSLGGEINRLTALRRVNKNVRSDELALAEIRKKDLRGHLTATHLRLDSIRLILRVP